MNIKQLVSILQGENEIYDQMLELCREEAKVLVAGNVKRLDEIVEIQTDLIKQVGIYEMQRVECVNRIADELHMEADKITVSTLTERLDGHESVELKSIQEHLSAVLAEFRDLNEMNSQLIKNSIDFIDYTLGLLLDVAEEINYDAGGKTHKVQINPAILDQKV
ncbi:flagellar protein FlgN [Mahella sp.]|uniref:flagellar protein FlgN n=1 Tax=Mahella sp. TaxID=2798721 RepID=UPI0025C316D5|nr:flagellar protein FlgN [Mahella sp.]MBZ4665782.1 FlgN family protein [Mahella sp.]